MVEHLSQRRDAAYNGRRQRCTEEESEDRPCADFARHHDRLVAVECAWDPENFFRMNKNIPPRR